MVFCRGKLCNHFCTGRNLKLAEHSLQSLLHRILSNPKFPSDSCVGSPQSNQFGNLNSRGVRREVLRGWCCDSLRDSFAARTVAAQTDKCKQIALKSARFSVSKAGIDRSRVQPTTPIN